MGFSKRRASLDCSMIASIYPYHVCYEDKEDWIRYHHCADMNTSRVDTSVRSCAN